MENKYPFDDLDFTDKIAFGAVDEIPHDLADDTVISPDGVNPVAKNDERPEAENSLEDGMNIFFPGPIPPAYFPGFPGGPSIG